MSSVKVFGSPTSSEVARVLACLFEKDVEFQLIRVDAFKGKERKPEYLKLQPTGQALTFDDGKNILVDSREICRHIADQYPEGNKELLGTGTLERASIEQWLQTEANSFDPPSSALVFHLAYPVPKPKQVIRVQGKKQGFFLDDEEEEEEEEQQPQDAEEVIQRNKKKLARVLDIYEQRLVETEYLAGDKFTLADLSHLPNTQRLMADTDFAALFTSRKRLSRWWEKISRRPTWKRVVAMQKEPPTDA